MPSIRTSFLRTRFGRRMLVLFLACAMLPLATLTVLVLRQASSETERQTRTNLQRTAKAVGMSLVAELKEMTEYSERIAHAATSPNANNAGSVIDKRDAQRLRAVVVLAASGDTLFMWPRVFPSLARAVLPRNETKLLFRVQTEGELVLAVTSGHAADQHDLRVVALVDPLGFFGHGDVQAWRDSGIESCALLDGAALWCSIPRELWSRVNVLGANSVDVAGTGYAAATWSGFAPVSEPGTRLEVLAFGEPQVALGGSTAFQRSLIVLVLASLVFVFLISHVQLRRSLRPLEELTQATQRVGAHNIGMRVEVQLNDEFGMLARSFNEMSGRLASHVALLSSSAAINDEALRASSVPDLLPRLAMHVRTLLPSEYGLSLSVRLEHARWLRRSSMTRSSDWVEDELELGMGSLTPLLRGDLVAGRFGGRDSQSHMRAPTGQSGWSGPAVAIPLRADEELVGILTVLVPDGMLATSTVLDNLRSLASDVALALNRTRLVGRLEQFNYGTLTALARTVDAKSPWTAGHSESVTHAALKLGEHMRLTSDELDLLHRGGLLHDIGKIAIPGGILDKPAALTPEEMTIVQSHPEVGARILAPIEAYAPIIPIVLYHHERFDGSGYPHRLRGHAIPSLARLVAVVDVYDALVSDRPYREGWQPERAAARIQESAGTHFDPVMATAFVTIEPSLRRWYAERREQDQERRLATRPTELTAV
ncbi:MAG: HD domain-containing phosphohydrolase [Gemmatimonadaceae bacterium]